jgi:hypothetical protein
MEVNNMSGIVGSQIVYMKEITFYRNLQFSPKLCTGTKKKYSNSQSISTDIYSR